MGGGIGGGGGGGRNVEGGGAGDRKRGMRRNVRKEEGEIERRYRRTPAGEYKRKEWKMREEYTRGEQGERERGLEEEGSKQLMEGKGKGERQTRER